LQVPQVAKTEFILVCCGTSAHCWIFVFLLFFPRSRSTCVLRGQLDEVAPHGGRKCNPRTANLARVRSMDRSIVYVVRPPLIIARVSSHSCRDGRRVEANLRLGARLSCPLVPLGIPVSASAKAYPSADGALCGQAPHLVFMARNAPLVATACGLSVHAVGIARRIANSLPRAGVAVAHGTARGAGILGYF